MIVIIRIAAEVGTVIEITIETVKEETEEKMKQEGMITDDRTEIGIKTTTGTVIEIEIGAMIDMTLIIILIEDGTIAEEIHTGPLVIKRIESVV